MDDRRRAKRSPIETMSLGARGDFPLNDGSRIKISLASEAGDRSYLPVCRRKSQYLGPNPDTRDPKESLNTPQGVHFSPQPVAQPRSMKIRQPRQCARIGLPYRAPQTNLFLKALVFVFLQRWADYLKHFSKLGRLSTRSSPPESQVLISLSLVAVVVHSTIPKSCDLTTRGYCKCLY